MYLMRDHTILNYKGTVRKDGRIKTLVDFDVTVDINGVEISILKLLTVDDLRNIKLKFLETYEAHELEMKGVGHVQS